MEFQYLLPSRNVFDHLFNAEIVGTGTYDKLNTFKRFTGAANNLLPYPVENKTPVTL